MRPKRPREKFPQRLSLLIVCEGAKTEWFYFDGLRSEEKVQERFEIRVQPGKGSNALSVVKRAIALRDEAQLLNRTYNEVWCVLDVDDASRRVNLREAMASAKKEKNIFLALSNPSIEVWLIAHFERIARSFQNSDAAEAYLNRTHWQPTFGQEYAKSDVRLYSRLADRVDAAVTNARWTLETHHANGLCADCNSSTDVFRLVEYLGLVGEEAG